MATKNEIFDYVMHTPENTNPAVLKSLLETISDNSSSNIDTGTHHTLKLVSVNIGAVGTQATQSLYIETEQGGNILDIPYVLATPSAYQVLHFISEESVDTTIQDPTDETIVVFALDGNTSLLLGSDLEREYNTELLFNFPACSDPNSIPENLGTVYYLTQPINDCFLLMLDEIGTFLIIPSSTGDITTDPQFEVRSINLET